MSRSRSRLRRLEIAAGIRSREPESVAEMSDDQLARIIGGPGTRPEDLTDQELEAIVEYMYSFLSGDKQ